MTPEKEERVFDVSEIRMAEEEGKTPVIRGSAVVFNVSILAHLGRWALRMIFCMVRSGLSFNPRPPRKVGAT